MSGNILNIEEIIVPDQLACAISNKYLSWEMLRQNKIQEWKEIQQYVFATDTTKTTNSRSPWSNKTTLPKLCQIRDNLFANYMAALFPKRKWLQWVGDNANSESLAKKQAIEGYMMWAIDRPEFYNEISKCVLDYIDYGQPFAMPEWVDQRVVAEEGREQTGYVGPAIRRISPLDIVMNPTASDFQRAPKIVRSLVSLGEVKDIIMRTSHDDGELEQAQALWDYLTGIREHVTQHPGETTTKDAIYEIAGFSNYRNYLEGDFVEVLTFYGDLYDADSDTFLKNYIIKIVDRHKIIYKAPNPSAFGYPQLYHVGWRVRPDNLWAMGPLDNLVGMQYRIDHLENLKADVFDVIAWPMFKQRGVVADWEYRPLERIILEDGGDVEMIAPPFQALQADNQIAILEAKMEEMAGSPREAMGFRTPGEKTKYEVQRLELAAGRIFQSKIAQFERDFLEPLLNGMLELARRHVDQATIRVYDTEFKINQFQELSDTDITGAGRLRPFAARHFAEVSNKVQNLTSFFGSAPGQDQNVLVHFSGEKLARLWEELLELGDDHIVQDYVRIAEQADAQRRAQSVQEQVAVEQQTPTGIYPGDYDPDVALENQEAQAPQTGGPQQTIGQ